jgi:hypothetical protein
MRENPDGHTGIAVANGQGGAGRIASETSGRMAEAELGAGAALGRSRRTRASTGNRQTDTGSQDAETNTGSQRTARQKTTGNAGRIAELAEHQEARRTGTEAGTSLADVLRAIASLSEADRELLLQLRKTLRGANT